MYTYSITTPEIGQTCEGIQAAMRAVRKLNVSAETICAIENDMANPGDRAYAGEGITVSRFKTVNTHTLDALHMLSACRPAVISNLQTRAETYNGVKAPHTIGCLFMDGLEVIRYSPAAKALVVNMVDGAADVINHALAHFMPSWHSEASKDGIWCNGGYYAMAGRKAAFVVLNTGRIIIN